MKKKSPQKKKKPPHRIMPGVEVSDIPLIKQKEYKLNTQEKI